MQDRSPRNDLPKLVRTERRERADTSETLGYAYVPADWREEHASGHELREVADVCVDPSDRVYLFTRGEKPYESEVLLCDRDGAFVHAFGCGLFKDDRQLVATAYAMTN